MPLADEQYVRIGSLECSCGFDSCHRYYAARATGERVRRQREGAEDVDDHRKSARGAGARDEVGNLDLGRSKNSGVRDQIGALWLVVAQA